MLQQHHPLWMSIHFTHPDELTPEATEACARLADAGIPLGSQTVLLKGVNDDVEVMKQLMHGLLMIRVRPYYLYQCDPITGSAHFRTPVEKGLEIIRGPARPHHRLCGADLRDRRARRRRQDPAHARTTWSAATATTSLLRNFEGSSTAIPIPRAGSAPDRVAEAA